MKNTETQFFEFKPFDGLSALLMAFLLIMALSGVHNTIINIVTVGVFELLFIFAYTLSLRRFSAITKLWKSYRWALVCVLLWFLSTVLSLFFSVTQEGVNAAQLQAIYASYILFILHVVFGFCVASFIVEADIDARRFLWALSLGVFALCVYMAFLLLTAHEGMDRYWVHELPFAINIRHVGYWVTAGSACAFALLLIETSRLKQSCLFVVAVGSAAMLIWMGGRTGAFSWLFSVGILCLMAWFTGLLTWKKFSLIISAVVAAFFLSEVSSVYDWNGITRMVSTASEVNSSGESEGFTEGRTLLWSVAIDAWKTSPWFGLGANAFLFLPDRPHGIHPHNFLIQLLLEWGVVGLALFLAVFVFACCYPLIKVFNTRSIMANQLVAGTVLLSLLIHALTDGIFWYARPLMYISLTLAIYLTASQVTHAKQVS